MGKPKILLFAAAFAGSAQAQTAMFSSIATPANDQTPPPTAVAVYPATFNHSGMRGNPASIALAIPHAGGTVTVVAQRRGFRGVEGFAPNGAPLPNLGAASYRYEWTGSGNGYDVRVTDRRGAVSGLIVGSSTRFVVRTGVIEALNLAAFPADDRVANDAALPANVAIRRRPASSHESAKASGANDFDLLVLYTEEARREACVAALAPDADASACDICSNAADVRALIDQAVADTRETYANSTVQTSVGNVTVRRMTGFPTSSAEQARARVLESAVVADARDAAFADLVSVIAAPTQVAGACGVAFVQRPGCTYPTPTPGCGVGAAYEPFAVNVVSHVCATGTDAFVHELTHGLGGEHQPGPSAPPAWAAAFPFHFGHFEVGAFETVMSVARPPNTPQVLHLSNPDVFVAGLATGIVDQRDNARGVNALFGAIREFRDGPLFADAFESEDACNALAY